MQGGQGQPDILALEQAGMQGPPGAHGGNGPQTNPATGLTSGGQQSNPWQRPPQR